MNEEDVLEKRYEILKEIFNGDAIFNRVKSEVVLFCPKHDHHKRKLSVNVKKNEYHCWVCGYSGKKIFFLLKENANKDQAKRYIETLGINFSYEKNTNTNISLPKEYKFILNNKNTPQGMMAYNFLRENNISEKRMLQNKIGFCETGQYANRVVFPSFDEDGKLNFFETRRFDDGNYQKYLSCDVKKKDIVFNEIFIDWSKSLILVENIKSSIIHSDLNVVPILGSSLSEDSKLFEDIVLKCNDVYIALDPDANSKALKLCDILKSYCINANLVEIPKQPDELDTASFMKYINSATAMSFRDYFVKKLNIKVS